MELKDKKNPKLGASLGRFRKILVSLKKKNTKYIQKLYMSSKYDPSSEKQTHCLADIFEETSDKWKLP